MVRKMINEQINKYSFTHIHTHTHTHKAFNFLSTENQNRENIYLNFQMYANIYVLIS